MVTREEVEEVAAAAALAAVREEHAQRIAHPEHRQRFTRFTTPEGKSYTAVTMSHFEWMKNIAAIVTAVAVILGGFDYLLTNLSVGPLVDRKIAAHEEQVRARMAKEEQNYVLLTDWRAWTATKDERWRQQDIDMAEIKTAIGKLGERQDRIIENQIEILRRLGLQGRAVVGP